MMKRLMFIFLGLLLNAYAQPSPLEGKEYDLKAAFIYKFTNYIEWDTPGADNTFTIGVFGFSPINSALTKLSQSKYVKEKKIIIRQFHKIEEITPCHILFISQKASIPLDNILNKAGQKGTLIISEKTGYAKKGTDINFVLVDNSLKFEANTKAISNTGLKVSSQLLKLAIIVD